MSDILIVAFFSLVGGILSLAGGVLLLSNEKRAETLLRYITPFAAGALLAAAFIDLLPEATHLGDAETALRWTLAGIVIFFLLERFVRWFHHHHQDHEHEPKVESNAPLIIIGDTIHNFIDGIAIAAAFLIDVPTGIVTTLAVAAHEIPQEVGDFGLLLKKGMSRANVIKANVASSLATTIAAVGFYTIGQNWSIPFDVTLGLVAGFFVYIAVSDIIPSIHQNKDQRLASFQSAMVVVGILVVGAVTTVMHDLIDGAPDHHESSQHIDEHDEEGDHTYHEN